jgi:uncharacterized membrane protein
MTNATYTKAPAFRIAPTVVRLIWLLRQERASSENASVFAHAAHVELTSFTVSAQDATLATEAITAKEWLSPNSPGE